MRTSFFFLAQTCGSRGYYSICRGQYSPSGVIVIPNRDTMTPFRLPSLAYIKPVKQCAGILRTTKKKPLSTKRSIEVWNLMKQRQSTGDTPQSPSEMRSIPSLLTLQHIKLIKLCVDPNEGSKKKILAQRSAVQGIDFSVPLSISLSCERRYPYSGTGRRCRDFLSAYIEIV